jgi:hypothetical protein
VPGVTFGAKAMSLFVSERHADASSKYQRVSLRAGRHQVFFSCLLGLSRCSLVLSAGIAPNVIDDDRERESS